jgi:arylsulfatase A
MPSSAESTIGLPRPSRRSLLAAAAAPAARLMASRRPPNVILILADDAGRECFEPYGSRQYSTPSVSRLAKEGVRFDHCYATPLCTPTRTALMTGKSNVRNYTDFGAFLPGQYTFADLFRKAGYATAIAGKWQMQGTESAKGVPAADCGFDTYCLWNTGRTSRDRYWNPSLECDGKLLTPGKDEYGPDIQCRFLEAFIEKNRDRPFFVYGAITLPHSPFTPTPDSKDRNSKDPQSNFADMIAYTDKVTGRLVAAVDRLGLRDNTLIVFTADNGTEHTIRSRLGDRTIRGDKGAPTGAGTHVPLIVRGPGVPAGRVRDDLIDFTDFLPTMAEAIGARLPENVQIDGRSFWPQLTGRHGHPREWIYTYYFPRPFASSFDTPYAHPEIRYAHDRSYKLYSDGRLFHTAADPEESKPVAAGAVPEIRRKLQAAIDSFPAHGQQIPRERWEAARGVKPPVW